MISRRALRVILTVIVFFTTCAFSLIIFDLKINSSRLMMSSSIQTKNEISKEIPLGTPIEIARNIMTSNGFSCAPTQKVRFADFANPLDRQIDHGPANTLYCDSGELMTSYIFITKRWQVSFEDSDGKVSYIAVGVGLTGP